MKLAAAAFAAVIPFAVHAQGCNNKTDVSVGGINGFTDLVNPVNTTQLRSCRIRLYVHRYAWERTSPDQQQAILGVFQGHGNPVIEVDLPKEAENYFADPFAKRFLQSGVTATEAHVNNFFPDRNMALWTRFVDAGHTVGLITMAPIWSPNSGQWRKAAFASPVWDNVRKAAVYGGGLTIDAPSDFWFAQAPEYRQFVIDEIHWANDQHMRTAVIVSPGKSGPRFLVLTQRFVASLKAAKAEPVEYIVENYDPSDPPTAVTHVGNEHETSSVTGVALWIAQQK